MTVDFEELSYRETPFGELIFRRRTEVSLGVDVYEVKPGDEFLMSSLFKPPKNASLYCITPFTETR